jgi:hypothetical protein
MKKIRNQNLVGKALFILSILFLSTSLAQASGKITINAEHSNPLARGMESIVDYGTRGVGYENNAGFVYTKLRCRNSMGSMISCPRGFTKEMKFLFKGITWNKSKSYFELELDKSKFPSTFFKSLKKGDPRLTSSTIKVVLGSPKSSKKPNERYKSRRGVRVYVRNNLKMRKVESKIEIDLGKISSSDLIAGTKKTSPIGPKPWPPINRPPWGKPGNKPPWALNPFDAPVHKPSKLGYIRFR